MPSPAPAHLLLLSRELLHNVVALLPRDFLHSTACACRELRAAAAESQPAAAGCRPLPRQYRLNVRPPPVEKACKWLPRPECDSDCPHEPHQRYRTSFLSLFASEERYLWAMGLPNPPPFCDGRITDYVLEATPTLLHILDRYWHCQTERWVGWVPHDWQQWAHQQEHHVRVLARLHFGEWGAISVPISPPTTWVLSDNSKFCKVYMFYPRRKFIPE
jgi:hypothetical protein